MKNTFLKKKNLKFFILVDFDAKMVNIANLKYSADADAGMRQVKKFFLHILVHLRIIRRSAHWTNLLGTPRGAPKYPRGLTRNKILFFESGVQMTQNALIFLDPPL